MFKMRKPSKNLKSLLFSVPVATVLVLVAIVVPIIMSLLSKKATEPPALAEANKDFYGYGTLVFFPYIIFWVACGTEEKAGG